MEKESVRVEGAANDDNFCHHHFCIFSGFSGEEEAAFSGDGGQIRSLRNQIDNWNHLCLSPSGYSVTPFWLRTFQLVHHLARQMWAPWCTPVSGKATEVSVTSFHLDLVSEI